MLKAKWNWKRSGLLAGLLLAVQVAWAGGVDDFPLAKAVPADACMAVHGRGHDGQKFLKEQYAKVWAEVEKARFDRDLKKMFKQVSAESGTSAEEFDAHWQKVTDLFTAVDWATLGDRESTFAMKFGGMMPEYLLLLRPKADKVQSNFDGLAGLVKALAALDANAMALASDEKGETTVHSLTVTAAPFPLGLTVARHKDTLLVCIGSTMFEQSLALLEGKPGESLAAGERFQAAFKKLPAATDEMMFVDVSKMMSQIRSMLGTYMEMAKANLPPEGDPEYADGQKAMKIPGKLIDMVDMFEYAAHVKSTDGMRSVTEGMTLLKADAKSKPMYKVFFGNESVKEPLKYIPKNAGSFSVGSGIDMLALYTTLIKFIKEEVPKSDEILAAIEGLKTDPGIDLEKDVFSWLQGGMSSVSIPGPNPYSPGQWSLMLRLRDEAKAREVINRVVKMAEAQMAQNAPPADGGGEGEKPAAAASPLKDANIPGADGFKMIVSPQLAMIGIGKPAFGIKDGHLFLTSGPEMVTTVLDTASGKVENFSKNERFAKEGLPPGKNVISLSFSDDTRFGEELGQALAMAPMLNMALGQQIAENPALGSLISMVGKVGRVVKKLDFLQSTASQMTMEGEMITSKTISNYREPPVASRPAGEAKEGDAAEKKE